MTYVLHLGHQIYDIEGVTEQSISTDVDAFDSAYDVNGLRFYNNKNTTYPFSITFDAPTGDLWSQFRFRLNSEFPQPSASDGHMFEFHAADGTIIARLEADIANSSWRAAVFGDTTETGAAMGTLISSTTFWFDIRLVVDTNIEMYVYIDGTLVSQAIAANTGNVGKPVKFSTQNGKFHDTFSFRYWYWAHFAFLDNVSTIGRRFIRNVANTAGFYNDWDGNVSVLSDGNSATRMTSDVSGERQSVTLSGPSVPVGTTLPGVYSKVAAQAGTEGINQVAPFIRIGSTDYDGTLTTVPLEQTGTVFYAWDQNPDTNTGWDDTNLPTEVGFISGSI